MAPPFVIDFEPDTQAAIEQLRKNLTAPILPPVTEVDDTLFSKNHLLTLKEGWEPPHPMLVWGYFEHFKKNVGDIESDEQLAELLQVSKEKMKQLKAGETAPTYGLWRKFLIMTGRVQQEIIPVLGYVSSEG